MTPWTRFFRRDKADAEQRAELEDYVEITAAEYAARGMDAATARAAARRQLGNTTLIREEVYRMNTISLLDGATRSTRQALRMLHKKPGFSIAAILSLALGIGANVAIFSVVNSVLIRPLPYPHPDTLIRVAGAASFQGQTIDPMNLSPAMYASFRQNTKLFEQFGVWRVGAGTVSGLGDPQQISNVIVTQGALPALGVQPQLGRWFSQADDTRGTPETIILSYGYWHAKFAGDPNILSRTITLDSTPRQVIGVMPQSFRFLNLTPDAYVPERFASSNLRPDVFNYAGIARLKPGVTLPQANQDIVRALRIWRTADHVEQMVDMLHMKPGLVSLKEDVVGDVGAVLWVLMGALGLVLLLVCANVANLLLVRSQGRQQEFTIRTALGAGWGAIARELLVESMTLGVLGGAVGVALAYGGLRLLVAEGPANLPRIGEISIDTAALAFALVCSLGSSLLFSLIPVFKHARLRPLQSNRSSSDSRERRRAQDVLVVAQVALALVLLVASGLMIRSFAALRAVNPGFTHAEQIQSIRISIPYALVPEPERVVQMQVAIIEKLQTIPGVSAAAFANGLPMELEYQNGVIVSVEGVTPLDKMPPARRVKYASPGLLKAQGTPILAGRDFTWDDVHGRRKVALVSENMARESWGQPEAALGKRLAIGRDRANTLGWLEVVGVVGDVHDDGAHLKAPPTVYGRVGLEDPGNLSPVRRSVTLAIRSNRTGTESFIRDVTKAIHDVNPNLPLAQVRTLDETFKLSMARTSFTLVLLGVAGGMALVLGIIGIYGVLAFAVAQRRREVGIRMALGAESSSVKAMFVRHGLLLTGIGIAIGLACAAVLSRWIASLLFGITPVDPATYAATALVLLAAAMTASYIPARRASAVHPAETLRGE